jgi:hypothetical protein
VAADRSSAVTTVTPSDMTPEDLIEAGFQQLERALASDLLERVKGCSPEFFERLVVEWLVKMGYGGSLTDAGRAIGRSGDQGSTGLSRRIHSVAQTSDVPRALTRLTAKSRGRRCQRIQRVTPPFTAATPPRNLHAM